MNPDTQDKSLFTANVITALIIGLILGFLIGAYYGKHDQGAANNADQNNSGMTDQNSTSTSATTTPVRIEDLKNHMTSGNSEVNVKTKKAGNNVVLEGVILNRTYWIAIRDSVPSDKIPYILGARRIQAGSYTNVSIPLSRDTEQGKRYEVVLYQDTGGSFNFDPKYLVAVTPTSAVLFSFQAQ